MAQNTKGQSLETLLDKIEEVKGFLLLNDEEINMEKVNELLEKVKYVNGLLIAISGEI